MAEPHDKLTVDAWNEYHAQTRNLIGAKYEKLEPYLWCALQAKLGKLTVNRKTRVKAHA